jgi:hypothetical protein
MKLFSSALTLRSPAPSMSPTLRVHHALDIEQADHAVPDILQGCLKLMYGLHFTTSLAPIVMATPAQKVVFPPESLGGAKASGAAACDVNTTRTTRNSPKGRKFDETTVCTETA